MRGLWDSAHPLLPGTSPSGLLPHNPRWATKPSLIVRCVGLCAGCALLLLAPTACGVEGPEDTSPEGYACTGTPAGCLRTGSGWTFEGEVVAGASFVDVSILRLPDGRYRLYGGGYDTNLNSTVLDSYVSDDGVAFQKEPGHRYVAMMGRTFVLPTPDGGYRLYYPEDPMLVNDLGAPSIKSAFSADGLTFTSEPGERLTYSGAGYEVDGLRDPRIVPLPDGRYRMYYRVGGSPPVLLSAVSADGLTWTREGGVRFDWSEVCPPELGGTAWPLIDSRGTFHLIVVAVKCAGNYENPEPGIWDGTSSTGLSFTLGASQIVEGYYRADVYTGDPTDPAVIAQDPAAVLTPSGLRVYFGLYGNSLVPIPEAGIYAVSTTSIH
jgi:hypothetical protein